MRSRRRTQWGAAALGLTVLLGGCNSSGSRGGPAGWGTTLPPATSTPEPPPTSEAPPLWSATGSDTSTDDTTGPTSSTSTRSSSSSTTRASKADRAGTKGLEADLRNALVEARQAAPSSVRLHVTSGYRPASVQERLWRDAVKRYGSRAEARKWVLPPEDSSHVQRKAVDIGPRSGAHWLEVHGAEWGLCRAYRNEWWHFEHIGRNGTCPPMAASAAAATAD
ncbi:M15 family metallopeptidase [Luteipulveratus flavus]|uniref:M15 family metallopeptidase n=1 Tax=Luteipulveratus flavus TaxID=3031728 RepID=A0ABT6CAQ9_9MICO|nr:M15 family metallopeptidase [Luteipulveratus sp. YIM 133296]MDF8265885.1 M15 family metallopeptidase [Luteipulveratus sp. YIM 133296]